MKKILFLVAALCLLHTLTTYSQRLEVLSSENNHVEVTPAEDGSTDSMTVSNDGADLNSHFRPLPEKAHLISLTIKTANSSVQKRNGLIKIGVGIAAIAFGAVTYSMLVKDHKDYKNTIVNPEGITSYAKPGIYVSGGAAAAGLAISLSSLPNFRKRNGNRIVLTK